MLFHEGDPASSLHVLVAGRLAVSVSTPAGDTAMLNLLSPGDSFGELSLLRHEAPAERSATVLALEPSETLSLSAVVFRRLCTTHPEVEQLLATLLSRRVKELSGRLLEAMYVGVGRRVYARLFEFAEVYTHDAGPVTVPLTQSQLADLVGGSRPTVNQALQRLAEQGVVELGRGRVTVRDRTSLRRRGHG